MPNHVGKEGTVKIGTNTIAELKGWSLEESANTVDDTELGDDWETCKPGLKSWSATIDCHWDETDATGQGAMTLGAEVTLNLYAEGATTGDTYYTGSAIITGKSKSGANGEVISQSFSLKGNGALTESTAV